ncbi:PREDICTED: uncharacterized protein LOC106118682 [Papilio xuthus]|uniref:Uncharacterized protein LOC106118682 n=2 Tax=Papilio xuthus TaxID=66420 RepID=A0AAJ6ZB35_PAPXU|nr:PREDICTED: uncharacterized protein LOC106118682 [Papilio xuthus]
MKLNCLYLVLASVWCGALCQQVPAPVAPAAPASSTESEEPPEGYYAFVESPNATPPRVRPPPYRQSSAECGGRAGGVGGAGGAGGGRAHVTALNLCGDLNRGLVPRNPLGQLPHGQPYPFELIRNETLRFLSRTLPVLRADDALPRVAHVPHPPDTAHYPADSAQYPATGAHYPADRAQYPATGAHYPAELPQLADINGNRLEERARRSLEQGAGAEGPRESRKFCEGGGVLCMLYRAINGDSAAGPERREDPGAPAPVPARYEGPPTPCPARVEYATPVFARNYQGVWRYVVQIPYEGYFTQTVEVTRCMQSRCHFLEGGCLSSPRWVSLLVAELHHQPQPQHEEAQDGSSEKSVHCDTNTSQGCYQVRLYYDWFLVPGSCKCWRPDYFARYVRRHHEL